MLQAGGGQQWQVGRDRWWWWCWLDELEKRLSGLRSGPRRTWKAPGKKAKMKIMRKMQLLRRLASKGIESRCGSLGSFIVEHASGGGECGAL